MGPIKVLILLGSKYDMPTMVKAAAVLDEYGVSNKTLVRSAHRSPEATAQAVIDAEAVGCKVFICAAGMAAHLAGAVASNAIKPVIGVPVASGALQGQAAGCGINSAGLI